MLTAFTGLGLLTAFTGLGLLTEVPGLGLLAVVTGLGLLTAFTGLGLLTVVPGIHVSTDLRQILERCFTKPDKIELKTDLQPRRNNLATIGFARSFSGNWRKRIRTRIGIQQSVVVPDIKGILAEMNAVIT